MVTLKFKCGCFMSLWSDKGEMKAALACCHEHEAPYRRIKDILPLELEDISWGRDE
jgi:hypothetical protein